MNFMTEREEEQERFRLWPGMLTPLWLGWLIPDGLTHGQLFLAGISDPSHNGLVPDCEGRHSG
jgi:hypothetical protein